ncbi:H-NS histone family protein [Paraburkholderia hospita]|jgi:DNA-binding protein H-NS|nr:H-NS histone family protein [Paraburkholderia hospita]SKD05121.1 H-NS histone family protein [Paraburkholderia hospita]SKD05203.1 H-NS histone family protein [Burkholderia sp. CF099]
MAQDEIQQKSAKYRGATGEAWSGDGEMPQLLKQALRAEYAFVAATTQGLLRVA